MAPVQKGSIVAVTGATGFIGSHCVKQLLEKGFTVRAVVRDPKNEAKVAHLTALANAAQRLTMWHGDLGEEGSYDAAFNGADAVVHTAAVVELGDVEDPVTMVVDPSVKGVKNVLASAEKATSVKRFVHTSSEMAAMMWDKALDSVFTEDSWNTASTLENDPYGYAKALAEKSVLEFKSSHFDVISILPGVNLGPCMTESHTNSSAYHVKMLMLGDSFAEYSVQFVDVRDSALAHVLALSVVLREDDSRRFLLVRDEPMMVSELEVAVQELFPDYVIKAELFPNSFWKAVMRMPLIGAALASPLERIILEQSFCFDNIRSKSTLGVTYLPRERHLARHSRIHG